MVIWFHRLPRDCISLIYEFDSTFSTIFTKEVLQIDKNIPSWVWNKEWKKELPFYKKVIESKMVTYQNVQGILQLAMVELVSDMRNILPYAHEIRMINNHVNQKYKTQELVIQYETNRYWFIVWNDFTISIEQFMIHFMDYYKNVKCIDNISCLLFLENDENIFQYLFEKGYDRVYVKMKKNMNRKIKNKKIFMDDVHFGFSLKLYLIDDKLIIYLMFDLHETRQMAEHYGMFINDYHHELYSTFLYHMNNLRKKEKI